MLALLLMAAVTFQPVDLQCESRTDPMGIDVPNPMLSWKIQSDEPGFTQSAYQIVVTDDQTRAQLWDSGQVKSSATYQIPYAGTELKSAEPVSWKVRIWNQRGKASDWSALARWTMFLMKPSDWTARWIGDTRAIAQGIGYHAKESNSLDDVKWVQVDLGDPRTIERIVLVPVTDHLDYDSFGFPVRYKVEVSDEPSFAKPQLVIDHTGEDQKAPIAPVEIHFGRGARYVRVTATKLFKRKDGVGCFALAELEAWDTAHNLAFRRPVDAKDSVERDGWSLAALTDGFGNAQAQSTCCLFGNVECKPHLKRALCYICGLGQYALYLNYVRVGQDWLTPSWTQYQQTCVADTYDVTSNFKDGRCEVDIQLGPGMYDMSADFRGPQQRNSIGSLKAICQLRFEYEDGTVENVGTSRDWYIKESPWTYCGVFGGEDYEGWPGAEDAPSLQGFDFPPSAKAMQPPRGKLVGITRSAPPLRVIERREPVKETHPKPLVIVYDLGQNAPYVPEISIAEHDWERGPPARIRSAPEVPGDLNAERGHDRERGPPARIRSAPEVPGDLNAEPGHDWERGHPARIRSAPEVPGDPNAERGHDWERGHPARIRSAPDVPGDLNAERGTPNAASGITIKLSPAEVLKPDGTIDQTTMRAGKYCSLKINGRAETWHPTFWYCGSRYWQAEAFMDGNPIDPKPFIKSFTGLMVHSTVKETGSFECSNDLLNKTYNLIHWAIRSNLSHVISDCPHREKSGWLEQLHLMGPSLLYCYDLTAFFPKIVDDMEDAQHPDGRVPTMAPEYFFYDKAFADSIEWGGSFLLVPDLVRTWYGNEEVISRHYPAMESYVDYLNSQAKDGILDMGLGDWNGYDHDPRTPVAITDTAYLYALNKKLAEFYEIIHGKTPAGWWGDFGPVGAIESPFVNPGKPSGSQNRDGAYYRDMAKDIKYRFNREFVISGGGKVGTGSQSAQATALDLGVLYEGTRPHAFQQLLADIAQHDDAVSCGEVGHFYLLRTLAAFGRSDLVAKIHLQTEKPGYGYQLAHGATTLTEAWDARPISQNHFMLGQLMEWMYARLLGIRPDPRHPGYEHFIVSPEPVEQVTWAKGHYDSIRGRIEVSWKTEGSQLEMDLTVPPNSSAEVGPPGYRIKSIHSDSQDMSQLPSENLPAGRYHIVLHSKIG